MTVLLLGLPLLAQGSLPAGTELRAYLNQSCIVADEPYYLPDEDGQVSRALPFASIIVGKIAHALLSGAIRATAGQLGSVSKNKDMYFVAAKDVDLYRAYLDESPRHEFTDQLSCATVVAAKFGPDNSDCTHLYLPRIIPEMPIDDGGIPSGSMREDDSVENVLRRANICLDGKARSVYEFRFEYSEDGTAFRVENVGIWMNSLLSTNSKRAKRNVVYTVDLGQPAQDSDMRILASAWIHVGELSSRLDTDDLDYVGRSEWLAVPPLSGAAARAYQRDTAVHQDVFAEIQALERSVARNKRTLAGLNERIASASENVQDALMQEMDSVEFTMLRAESLLDARRAEYDELPQFERHYMPVTVRISVIESRSERKALATLAEYLEDNSDNMADTATDLVTYDRSFGDAAAGQPGTVVTLAYARDQYFDALIAVEEAISIDSGKLDDAEATLAESTDVYNAARTNVGIPEIE